MAERRNRVRIAILGASGYTGGEFVAMLPNMNAMLSIEETTGLEQVALFP